MNIGLYISELLYGSDCVIIPGLGGFVANTRSAFLNPSQHTFTPPSRRIAFNASLRTNDGLLANYVSRRSGANYAEALNAIRLYTEDVLAKLGQGDQVWIDSIGVLSFDAENRIQFEPDQTVNYRTDAFGLVSIHSPAIRRDAAGSKVRKMGAGQKEKNPRQLWRLVELVPVAAILAILLFNPNIIERVNSGLAEIIPLKEIYRGAEINYSGIKEDEPVGFPVDEKASLSDHVLPPSVQEEPLENVSTSTTNEIAAVDSTAVEAVNPAPVVKELADNTSGMLHIVGGCFKSEENARKLVEEADLLGFSASVIGKNDKGMFIVSLYSGTDRREVEKQLNEVKLTFVKSAWVLSK